MIERELWHGNWTFCKTAWEQADPGVLLEGEKVTLPHTWYRDGEYYLGEAVYQKKFQAPVKAGERTFLQFHGVDKSCRVYLNGVLVAEHQGAYTMFGAELTRYLREGENLLTVYVSNEKGSTVHPLSGDFATFGGIIRKVEWIRVASDLCFDRMYCGTEGIVVSASVDEAAGSGSVIVRSHLAGDLKGNDRLRVEVYDPKGNICAEETFFAESKGEHRITVSDPELWDGKGKANLYTVRTKLLRGGEETDCIERRTGFRTAGLDPDHGFYLNGRHLKLNGVAKHQDTAEVFAAVEPKHVKRDFELIGEIGANAVRLSHYPHPQEAYDLCDEMGLAVWSEIPVLKLTDSEELFRNAECQLTEMILQNMHHPGIFFWGLQNEIAIFGEEAYMPPKIRALNDLAHKLDGSRITVCANLNSVPADSLLNRSTDAVAYNLYFGWYYGEFGDYKPFLEEFHRTNPQVPVAISEYGVDTNTAYHSGTPAVNDYTEEFQALYHETVYPILKNTEYVWGTFIWNMFDFVSPIRHSANIDCRNLKGLVTHDRMLKKDSFYYYKAQWSGEPFVHIAEKRFRNRASDTMTVKVYSCLKEVSLAVNGRTYVQQADDGVFWFEGIPLLMGDNEAEARGRIDGAETDVCDRAVFTRCAEPDPSYVCVDENPGLNVANWFVDEVEEAKLFPEGFYSVREKIDDLRASGEVMALIDRMLPDLGKDLRDTLGRFTLEQYIAYNRPPYTEEQIKDLNAGLTKIRLAKE